jgi:hypothetical protein
LWKCHIEETSEKAKGHFPRSTHTDVIQVALSGNRIAILRANGEAVVKEGGPSTGWTTEHTDVKHLALY